MQLTSIISGVNSRLVDSNFNWWKGVLDSVDLNFNLIWFNPFSSLYYHQWICSAQLTTYIPPKYLLCLIWSTVPFPNAFISQFVIQPEFKLVALFFRGMHARGPKSLNFPDGNFQRAKTFRTRCVNRFREKTRKPCLRQKRCAQILFVTKKCINSFCNKKVCVIRNGNCK